MALSFSYFSKALTGTYMKSSITQIERRFDLSSTHIGLIDGSFEMGKICSLPSIFQPPTACSDFVRPCRQLAVFSCGEPLWGSAPSPQTHRSGMFPHVSRHFAHRPHSLFHGPVRTDAPNMNKDHPILRIVVCEMFFLSAISMTQSSQSSKMTVQTSLPAWIL